MKDPVIELLGHFEGDFLRFIADKDGNVRFEAGSDGSYGVQNFELSKEQLKALIAWFKELEKGAFEVV